MKKKKKIRQKIIVFNICTAAVLAIFAACLFFYGQNTWLGIAWSILGLLDLIFAGIYVKRSSK